MGCAAQKPALEVLQGSCNRLPSCRYPLWRQYISTRWIGRLLSTILPPYCFVESSIGNSEPAGTPAAFTDICLLMSLFFAIKQAFHRVALWTNLDTAKSLFLISKDEPRRGDSVIPIDPVASRDMSGASITVTKACQ